MELNLTNLALAVPIISGIVWAIDHVLKYTIRIKVENDKIYSDIFDYKYSQLFEYKKQNECLNISYYSDDYNVIDISIFCHKVLNFKSNGNKFKGFSTNILFNSLYNSAKKIDEKKDVLDFAIDSFIDNDATYLELYRENKPDFQILKTRFMKFYLKIYPILD